MRRYIQVAFMLIGLGLLLKYPPQPKEVKEVPLVTIKEPLFIVEAIPYEGEDLAPYPFIPLDDELQIYMESLCADMELDFFLCAALMESESSFREDAISRDGKDIGLFQIRASVWEDYFKEMGLDIYDPRDNIQCGLHIIKKLCDKYPAETALQCYKCGESRGLELMEEGIVLTSISTIIDRKEEWQRKEP